MKMTQSRPALLASGNATAAGTRRYRDRFAGRFAADHFRVLGGDLHASSIGIGTYLGECDDPDDDRYARTIRRALESGINVIDSAINYRCQRSEQASLEPGRSRRCATMARRAVACGAVSCRSWIWAGIASPMPSLVQSACATRAKTGVR